MDYPIDAPVKGSYPDPRVLRMSGLDRMNLIHEGRSPRPPTHYLCGHSPTDWSSGQASFALPDSPWFQIARGLVSPGVVALPADAALGTAFFTTLGPGLYSTTSELSINYLRPVRRKRLAARATLIDSTPHQGLVESSVFDEDGRMVAHLTSRYMTLKAPIDVDSLTGEVPLAEDPPASDGLYLLPLSDEEVCPPQDDRSGLDVFSASNSGEIPVAPIVRLLGLSAADVSEGHFRTTIPSSRWFTSPAGTIYGGVTALALEIATTAAATTTIPIGQSCAPLDLKIQYLRPWFPDGERCELIAEVVHRGRSMAVINGEIRNSAGKPIALATGSCLILDRPWSDFVKIDSLPAAPEEN